MRGTGRRIAAGLFETVTKPPARTQFIAGRTSEWLITEATPSDLSCCGLISQIKADPDLRTRKIVMIVHGDDVMKGLASIVPPDADASAVANAIVKIVDTPCGKRPFRVHVDPTEDGAEVTNMVMDRVRAELLRRIGLGDLLQVSI